MVFHWRLHIPQEECFKVSHLCYAYNTQPQYEAVVKLLGSFRLTTGNRHLHRYCIFTERVLETVFQSLRHSCTSELRVYPCSHALPTSSIPLFPMALTISSSEFPWNREYHFARIAVCHLGSFGTQATEPSSYPQELRVPHFSWVNILP